MKLKIDSQRIQIPVPKKDEFDQFINDLGIYKSFTVINANDRKLALMRAHRLGVKVTSRKVDGKGYRIWRTA